MLVLSKFKEEYKESLSAFQTSTFSVNRIGFAMNRDNPQKEVNIYSGTKMDYLSEQSKISAKEFSTYVIHKH